MKRNEKPVVDGIVPRQRRRKLGDFNNVQPLQEQTAKAEASTKRRAGHSKFGEFPVPGDNAMELPESEVKGQEGKEPKRGRRRFLLFGKRKVKDEKPMSRRRRIAKRAFKLALVLAGLGVIGVGLKTYLALNNIIDRDGNGAPALTGDLTKLNGEGDGRINILMIGIGGRGHEAGNLSDTILVASIDPFAHEMAMLSVPRDMWVEIPGYGPNKINAAHSFGEDYGYNGKSKNAGIALLKATVEQTLDIPIHYYVRVDFDGFKQAVDAVGGVDVTVTERIYDTQFAWQYGILDLKPGKHHLDGTKALMYARSRYSSARGDFARADRQREILLELKKKVVSLGTYKDPRRVTALIDTAGGHVRTSLQLNEMLRLYEIIEQIPDNQIISAGLSTDADNYLTGQNIGGASALVPKSGSYAEIQRYVRKLLVDGFIRKEAAKVDVLNGAGVAGLATTQAELLESFGYNVSKVGDAPKKTKVTAIYDLTDGSKPTTKKYLENRYKVTMLPADQLPAKVTTKSDFVIILGSDATQTTQ